MDRYPGRLKKSDTLSGSGVFLIAAAISFILVNGCALTPPSSEAIIFKQPESENAPGPLFPAADNQLRNTENHTTFISPLGSPNIHISMTARPNISGELDYAKDEFSAFIQQTFAEDSTLTNADLKIRNPYYLSISSYYTILNRDKARWALNFGIPVLGTDLTAALSSRTYLTANIGFGDGELIIQHKLRHTKRLGLALGGYYRAERRGFEIEGDELSLVPWAPILDPLSADRIFYNHILGGRIYGYFDLGGGILQLRAAPGYAFNLQRPIINVSLSIGFN